MGLNPPPPHPLMTTASAPLPLYGYRGPPSPVQPCTQTETRLPFLPFPFLPPFTIARSHAVACTHGCSSASPPGPCFFSFFFFLFFFSLSTPLPLRRISPSPPPPSLLSHAGNFSRLRSPLPASPPLPCNTGNHTPTPPSSVQVLNHLQLSSLSKLYHPPCLSGLATPPFLSLFFRYFINQTVSAAGREKGRERMKAGGLVGWRDWWIYIVRNAPRRIHYEDRDRG